MGDQAAAAAATAGVTNAAPSNLIALNSASQTPNKLTDSNYSVWRLQFTSLLSGYGLLGFVTGDKACPPATITTGTPPVTADNPAHDLWKRQDGLLLNCIVGSISPELLPTIATVNTSAEAWRILSDTFATPSRGRIKTLKHNLRMLVKGTMSISAYFSAIKSKANELAALGSPIDPEDLIDIILANIGPQYADIARAVQIRDTIITLPELHEKLLNFEAGFIQAHTAMNSPVYSAFAAAYPYPRLPSPTNDIRPPSNRQHQAPNSGANRSSGSSQGNQGRSGYQGKCQWCGTQGHSAKRCPSLASSQPPQGPRAQAYRPPPQANHAQAQSWMLDSGASHHMTQDLSLLSLHDPYTGSDDRDLSPSGPS